MLNKILRDLRAARARHDSELRRLIAKAASVGTPSQEIANAVGVSRATLWRHYRNELRRPAARDHSLRTTGRDQQVA